ncbi:hypothetical protein [Nocardioides aquiterrae]|uniref:Uncharacterized protein n=1 Tax=Nocardioides aquiterrae TaxID=203799 RepID=A0ABN1UDC1_9ACTN
MRRALAALTILLCAAPLAACGGSESAPGDTKDPKVIDVTFKGDSVTPNGERVEVATGQDVELHVTADAPGEIHVHSTPEQELTYDKGETTLTIHGIDAPGTVDVESHSLDKVIVQLEVR